MNKIVEVMLAMIMAKSTEMETVMNDIIAQQRQQEQEQQQEQQEVAPQKSDNPFDDFCNQKGLSNDEKEYWRYIINKESGFNHLAVNTSSGACGLVQALPCEKMATHGADYRTNPYTQLAWGYDYVMNRYGSFFNAYNHHIINGWY